MNKRVIALLAAVLVTQMAGSRTALAQIQTGERAKAALTAEAILPVCDKALVAAMNGTDGAEVLADAVKDLPPEQRAVVVNICAVYIMGAIAAVKHRAEAEARAIKAGQGLSI
jgi:capsular polysaccharide biosynthesis protein